MYCCTWYLVQVSYQANCNPGSRCVCVTATRSVRFSAEFQNQPSPSRSLSPTNYNRYDGRLLFETGWSDFNPCRCESVDKVPSKSGKESWCCTWYHPRNYFCVKIGISPPFLFPLAEQHTRTTAVGSCWGLVEQQVFHWPLPTRQAGKDRGRGAVLCPYIAGKSHEHHTVRSFIDDCSSVKGPFRS